MALAAAKLRMHWQEFSGPFISSVCNLPVPYMRNNRPYQSPKTAAIATERLTVPDLSGKRKNAPQSQIINPDHRLTP